LYDQLAIAAKFDGRAALPVRDDSITEPEFRGYIGIVSAWKTFSGVDAT